jgi:transcriptional regulator with XRE-family HTH domain
VVTSPSPTALRRWIAYELRQLRAQTGKSREDAAKRIRKATTQIGHLETGRNLPSAMDLEALLNFYGQGDRAEFFMDLLVAAKKGTDWWQALTLTGAVPEWFNLFLGLEASASMLESYDAQVIPGLFQTEAYAEAVIRRAKPDISGDEVARRVELRATRQAILGRADPPHVWTVVDEAALRRSVGGLEVIGAQLDRLMELAERPHIDIQVLPASAGAHTGLDGTFTILSFPPEFTFDPGVVYVQTRITGHYYEEPGEIAEYRNALTRLRIQAISPEDSPLMIAQIAKELA